MMYNADFLIAAVVILLLVLRNFLDQKRAEDLNKIGRASCRERV